jgi:hypothetical protein
VEPPDSCFGPKVLGPGFEKAGSGGDPRPPARLRCRNQLYVLTPVPFLTPKVARASELVKGRICGPVEQSYALLLSAKAGDLYFCYANLGGVPVPNLPQRKRGVGGHTAPEPLATLIRTLEVRILSILSMIRPNNTIRGLAAPAGLSTNGTVQELDIAV